MDKYDSLLLKNQLCFPTYAVANKIVRKYQPLLDKINLTYTQYIVMMVMWEKKTVNEKELCDALRLKTNTLTPLLKKLKEKGFISINKDQEDKRNLVITLTKDGEALKEKAVDVPPSIAEEFNLTEEEALFLYKIRARESVPDLPICSAPRPQIARHHCQTGTARMPSPKSASVSHVTTTQSSIPVAALASRRADNSRRKVASSEMSHATCMRLYRPDN